MTNTGIPTREEAAQPPQLLDTVEDIELLRALQLVSNRVNTQVAEGSPGADEPLSDLVGYALHDALYAHERQRHGDLAGLENHLTEAAASALIALIAVRRQIARRAS